MMFGKYKNNVGYNFDKENKSKIHPKLYVSPLKRYGRNEYYAKCPTKDCKNENDIMLDIGSRGYVNVYCSRCECHYVGEVSDINPEENPEEANIKFWTQKEWDEAIEKAFEEENPEAAKRYRERLNRTS
jgi:hypothetical protein